MIRMLVLLLFTTFSILNCAQKTTTLEDIPDTTINSVDSTTNQNTNMPTGTITIERDSQAVVEAVTFSGEEENYTFQVRLRSPDTGCDQYADWWEVFNEDGQLIYRRILAHSHVNEQPFTRSGGPVNIKNNDFVYIRGHMNNLGYGSLVFGGTIQDGFGAQELPIEFAADLAGVEPLPTNCAF